MPDKNLYEPYRDQMAAQIEQPKVQPNTEEADVPDMVGALFEETPETPQHMPEPEVGPKLPETDIPSSQALSTESIAAPVSSTDTEPVPDNANDSVEGAVINAIRHASDPNYEEVLGELARLRQAHNIPIQNN